MPGKFTKAEERVNEAFWQKNRRNKPANSEFYQLTKNLIKKPVPRQNRTRRELKKDSDLRHTPRKCSERMRPVNDS